MSVSPLNLPSAMDLQQLKQKNPQQYSEIEKTVRTYVQNAMESRSSEFTKLEETKKSAFSKVEQVVLGDFDQAVEDLQRLSLITAEDHNTQIRNWQDRSLNLCQCGLFSRVFLFFFVKRMETMVQKISNEWLFSVVSSGNQTMLVFEQFKGFFDEMTKSEDDDKRLSYQTTIRYFISDFLKKENLTAALAAYEVSLYPEEVYTLNELKESLERNYESKKEILKERLRFSKDLIPKWIKKASLAKVIDHLAEKYEEGGLLYLPEFILGLLCHALDKEEDSKKIFEEILKQLKEKMGLKVIHLFVWMQSQLLLPLLKEEKSIFPSENSTLNQKCIEFLEDFIVTDSLMQGSEKAFLDYFQKIESFEVFQEETENEHERKILDGYAEGWRSEALSLLDHNCIDSIPAHLFCHLFCAVNMRKVCQIVMFRNDLVFERLYRSNQLQAALKKFLESWDRLPDRSRLIKQMTLNSFMEISLTTADESLLSLIREAYTNSVFAYQKVMCLKDVKVRVDSEEDITHIINEERIKYARKVVKKILEKEGVEKANVFAFKQVKLWGCHFLPEYLLGCIDYCSEKGATLKDKQNLLVSLVQNLNDQLSKEQIETLKFLIPFFLIPDFQEKSDGFLMIAYLVVKLNLAYTTK